jgi:citrate lyase subunit beta/citryl-CoA lyase
MSFRILKSLLYVPADNPRMIEKARDLDCSAIIFDLEDAISISNKSDARNNLRVLQDQQLAKPYFVRVNACATDFFRHDIRSLSELDPVGIVLPKADESAVLKACASLGKMEEGAGKNIGSTNIIPLIESAAAVESMSAILGASPRVIAAQLGAEDLTADLGIQRTTAGDEIAYARNRVVYGCRAFGLPSYDTPFPDFKNDEGLAADCRVAKGMGFSGKTCIHPAQIETINRLFSPSAEEIEQARRIVAAAEKESGGVFALDGFMIDAPVIERARRTLDLTDSERDNDWSGGRR